MSRHPYEMIAEFHEKFGLQYHGYPRDLPDDLTDFRFKFMEEELLEYLRGWQGRDLEKQLDALVDLVYVAVGTAYMHGFDFAEAFERVHEANMRKVRAERPEDSTRLSTWDVVKPEGWTPPVLTDLLEKYQVPRLMKE